MRLEISGLPYSWHIILWNRYESVFVSSSRSGGWLSIKMPSNQYSNSHYGYKTILRLSYLHNGNSYSGKNDICMLNQGAGVAYMEIRVRELGYPHFRQYIIGCYQNQWWTIANLHSRDEHQLNHDQISKFLDYNSIENSICKIPVVSNFLYR